MQDGEAVLPLFVVEPDFWQLPTSSRGQWCFEYDCLTKLHASLRALGQGLIIRMGALKKMRLIQYKPSPTSFRASLRVLVTALSKVSAKASATRDKGRRFGVIIEK